MDGFAGQTSDPKGNCCGMIFSIAWAVTFYIFSYNSINDPNSYCYAYQVVPDGPWASSPIEVVGVNDSVFASHAIQTFFAWGFILYSIVVGVTLGNTVNAAACKSGALTMLFGLPGCGAALGILVWFVWGFFIWFSPWA